MISLCFFGNLGWISSIHPPKLCAGLNPINVLVLQKGLVFVYVMAWILQNNIGYIHRGAQGDLGFELLLHLAALGHQLHVHRPAAGTGVENYN